MLRARRRARLQAIGFLPYEAMELSRASVHGMRAPYFRRLLAERKELYDKAKAEGWTDKQYVNYIRASYVDKGYLRKDKLGRLRIAPWDLLREYEEAAHRRGEEYESPWRRRVKRKVGVKREMKRVTRRDMLKSWIIQKDRVIERTPEGYKRDRLIEERDRLQKQLEGMDTLSISQ